MPRKERAYCTISVDVDPLRVLLKFHGADPDGYTGHDPVYEKAVPRFLDLFDEYGIKATFFVVAEDCLEARKAAVIKKALAKGHEIANHSLSHHFGFSRLSRQEKKNDIEASTRMIKDTLGKPPIGFRAPGYDIDDTTIDILEHLGYSYDSSVYKFFLYPAMRRLSYIKAGFIPKRHIFAGMIKETKTAVMPPMRPYRPANGALWRSGSRGRKIIEIPLSTVPFVNIPFNTTFIFMAGAGLFHAGFWLNRIMGLNINYNFHSTDLLSAKEDDVNLKHPGMNVPISKKIDLFRKMLGTFGKHCDFITLESLRRKAENGI